MIPCFIDVGAKSDELGLFCFWCDVVANSMEVGYLFGWSCMMLETCMTMDVEYEILTVGKCWQA